MKGFDLLIAHLIKFDTLRDERWGSFPSPDQRKEYANAIAGCFMPVAQSILAGYFKIYSSTNGIVIIREIHPLALELYYHEEGPKAFKDPIMYHTNDRIRTQRPSYFTARGISELPYYPLGALNPHTSGIDITFENAAEQYRASCLIRAYEVHTEGGVSYKVYNSTDIFDDMLLCGIPLENANWVEWCDGESLVSSDLIRQWRRNVPDYKREPGDPDKWVKNTEGEPSFLSSGKRYVKCPFDWRFVKK